MKDHTDVINHLAKKINAQFYLEIGISNPANNFNKIAVPFKVGVDPNPAAMANYCGDSDSFFRINQLKFDLIFIDGLHHADQVRRDFDNSLKVLNDGGYIVLHDTNPESEHLTHVPRDKKGRWLGDVYKFACELNGDPRVDFFTVDFDNGCTVVWKTDEKKETVPAIEFDFQYFLKNKKTLLKLVSAYNFSQL